MIKMLNRPIGMDLVAVVGIEENSEGLAMARKRGVATTHQGIEGLRRLDVFTMLGQLGYAATSVNAPHMWGLELRVPFGATLR